MKQQVICPNCEGDFYLYQPDDHTEYTPAGKCDSCGKGYLLFRYTTDGRVILTESNLVEATALGDKERVFLQAERP